ncbi:P-loop containing nucleoside triphosphate hydrolase protein [Coniochaeta ligniaria NRRL 30616]|uniref:p-loop containing nucleoside triphosphate hydrolase protein n=1 Tax=Coniochaeta ligniaria NRRL 30616 TaxID=1408157 RepID=A0A1J7ISY9_9PEZI|nr:P-loop containing nucleoside triphosphate hydrolase protein [Coniochaeta ligniaria NRRL 30616]
MGLIFIRALPEAEFRHRAAHGFKPPYYVPPGTHASTADWAEAEIRLLKAEGRALRARLAEVEVQQSGTGGWDEGRWWHGGERVFPRDGLSEVTSGVRTLPEGATVEDGMAEMGVSRMVLVGHDTADDAEKEKLLMRVQHAEHEREGLQRRLEEAQAERDNVRHQLVETETDRSTLQQHLTTAESDHTALDALYQQALSNQMQYLSQLRHHRGTISVIVRIRPPLCSPPAGSPQPTHTITPPGTLHILPGPNSPAPPESFTFDGIISGPSSTSSLAPQISSLATTTLQTHCRTTVFAYGRTGTGKSHTLSEVLSTLAVALFSPSTTTTTTGVKAKVSLVEIYNDTLLDLLVAPKKRSTKAAEPHQAEVKVKTTAATVDMTRSPAATETVSSAAGLLALVARGNARRAVAATECNAASSRSHSVLTIQMLLSDDKGEETKKNGGKGAGAGGGGGTFVVIDLAGHEDVGKSGVGERGGRAFAEARGINQSLHHLGKVFSELGGARQPGAKQTVSMTASFRADLLTRVFGWVLGYGPEEGGGRGRGRSRVLMVATVALDDAEGVGGARQTLGYAAQRFATVQHEQIELPVTLILDLDLDIDLTLVHTHLPDPPATPTLSAPCIQRILHDKRDKGVTEADVVMAAIAPRPLYDAALFPPGHTLALSGYNDDTLYLLTRSFTDDLITLLGRRWVLTTPLSHGWRLWR